MYTFYLVLLIINLLVAAWSVYEYQWPNPFTAVALVLCVSGLFRNL